MNVFQEKKPPSDRGQFLCEICNKMFTWRSALRNHQVIHKEKMFKCEVKKKKVHVYIFVFG